MAGPIADFVVSLSSDGRIASQGSISDALSQNTELLAEMRHTEKALELDQQYEEIDDIAGRLVVAEEIEDGRVSVASCESNILDRDHLPMTCASQTFPQRTRWQVADTVLDSIHRRLRAIRTI